MPFSLRETLKQFPDIERAARQLLALAPYRARLGRRFWEWYAFFNESEKWPVEQLQAFQMVQLRNLLTELAAGNPFYKQRLRDVNIPEIMTLAQFQANVPSLTRQVFRENFCSIPVGTPLGTGRLERSQTSGTTGMALQFFHPRHDIEREWASVCYQWQRVGYTPHLSRRAEFRGLTPRGHLEQFFPDKNMVRFSILHLQPDHVRRYAAVIRREKIEFLHGYPSALYLLARTITASGIDFPRPKGIMLASETVFDWQLAQLEEVFPKATLFAHYGCAEHVVMAGWCEHNRTYHILPQYSLVELDPATHEVVGTNLFNPINGFIRYRLMDTAQELLPPGCPDCGRPYARLAHVDGRREDYLFSPERGWIPPAIVTFPLKGLQAIREIQFYQAEPSRITLRFTRTEGAGETRLDQALEVEKQQVETSLQQMFGASTHLSWEQVDGFARGATGKFKWIICDLEQAP